MRTVLPKALWWVLLAIVLLIALDREVAYAQGSCVPIIDQLDTAIDSCAEVNSNWACYANATAVAIPADGRFDEPGDREEVVALEEIQTEREAGAVVMFLHLANEDSHIKVILFGGPTLDQPDRTRNVFTMRVEDDTQICPQTSPGMVVRTDNGERGTLIVNGVEIELRSTAYIALTGQDTMLIVNLEGQVAVTVGGQTQELPVGYQSQVVQFSAAQPVFAGPPSVSPLFDSPVAQWLASPDGLQRVSDPNTVPNPAIPACGGSIAIGQTITDQITVPGQECLYSFCVASGDVATIHMETVEGSLDPWVDLRWPDGRLMRFNNDIDETDFNSLICNRTFFVPGCYTIVARPAQNRSAGRFRLSVEGQSACVASDARCEVITQGLNLRRGPGLAYQTIRTLSMGARLRQLARSDDDSWAHVQVVGTAQEGWVSTNANYLSCEPIAPPALEPEPTDEPPPPPEPSDDDTTEPTSEDDCVAKCSPFP